MTHAWRAPGRVNLIGEHTDYNGGFALPFALAAGCTAAVSPRDDDVVTAVSAQVDEPVSVPVTDLAPPARGWSAYALGAVWALRRRGHAVGGVDIAVDSDVPVGAGLSSSAALVCSVTTALADTAGLDLADDELLAVTRSVENDFVGAPTGGMDQLASLRCVPDAALFCDMRDLATEAVPLPLAEAGLVLLVVDSHAPHAHADGEYRRRREGCERAAAELGVSALRDVTPDHLDRALARLGDDELRRYVRHVVTENDRVLRSVERLRAGDVAGIGPLLDGSHVSMRDDYRITIPAIDLAVDTLRSSGALGARMTGGGFGGCVIALLAPRHVDPATAAVREALLGAGHAEPGAFVVERAAGGAHHVTG